MANLELYTNFQDCNKKLQQLCFVFYGNSLFLSILIINSTKNLRIEFYSHSWKTNLNLLRVQFRKKNTPAGY